MPFHHIALQLTPLRVALSEPRGPPPRRAVPRRGGKERRREEEAMWERVLNVSHKVAASVLIGSTVYYGAFVASAYMELRVRHRTAASAGAAPKQL